MTKRFRLVSQADALLAIFGARSVSELLGHVSMMHPGSYCAIKSRGLCARILLLVIELTR